MAEAVRRARARAGALELTMWSALRAFRITDAIDILLVAVVLYRVFVMFKETRAIQMLLGLGGLMVASFAARRFDLFSTS